MLLFLNWGYCFKGTVYACSIISKSPFEEPHPYTELGKVSKEAYGYRMKIDDTGHICLLGGKRRKRILMKFRLL